MSSIKEEIGSGIRSIRKAKRISQENLADVAGVSPSYMGEVERGVRNISVETLEKICDALGVLAIDIFRASGLQKESKHSEKAVALEKHMAFMTIRSKQEIELINKLARDIFAHIEQE